MATYYVELDGGQLAPKTTLKGGDMTPKLQFEGAVIYPTSGGGGSANLQTKSATVSSVHGSASTATITPDPGYDGMDEVDLTISPIADGSVVVDTKTITVSSPFSFDATTGKISSHILNTTQGTATVTPGYVSSATPGDINVYTNKDQQLDVVGATTYTPSTTDQTIPAQKYLLGAQTFKGVTYSGLDASNIKKDVVVKIGDSADDDRILSVTGTYEGGGGGVDFMDFSGGNILAIVSHGTEYITTTYNIPQAIYGIKLRDTTAKQWEHYFALSNGGAKTGMQRNNANASEYTWQSNGATAIVISNADFGSGEIIEAGFANQNLNLVTADHPLLIFAGYYRGSMESSFGNFEFYGLNIVGYNGQYLARFFPWLENGVACVKDLVSGTIYTNSGTGAFDYIDLQGVLHNG